MTNIRSGDILLCVVRTYVLFCLFHYVQGDFTMRKKKKMSAVITLILFCGCFLFGSFLSFAQNSRTEEPVQFKCYKSIVIQEGDSWWSLAERHIDSESETAVKEYIKELKQINQLESETIQTGEHLIIPYYTTECCQADRAYLYCSIPFL